MPLTVEIPLGQLVSLCYERLLVLAYPPDREPSPVTTTGEPPSVWAAWAGCGGQPHEIMAANGVTDSLDIGPHDPANVAHLALQQMCYRQEADRVAGLPIRYRPVQRGKS